MIQFFINDNEIILPEEFSFTMVENNPEINSEGEFTLDITVSLLHPKNAIAFGFLNRLNISTINKTATCKLIDYGKTKFGTAIISKNTNTEVTFQFVSGNSELNYKSNADNRKIWQLDWGTETEIDYTRALDSIQNQGYYYHEELGTPPVITKRFFVCAPVKVGELIINNFTLQPAGWSKVSEINGISGEIIMQPYLMYYIKKLPELLGYSLTYNVLEDDLKAKSIFLINTSNSLKYSDALPDMSIAEFIESIETFFNVSFVVDNQNKSISIITTQLDISSRQKIRLKNVLDNYERTITDDSKLIKLDFTKISYDIDNQGYFKYQKLSDQILTKCELIEFSSADNMLNYWYSNLLEDKFIISRDAYKSEDYIRIPEEYTPDYNLFRKKIDDDRIITLVNRFRAYGNLSDRELILKIVPTQVIYNEIPLSLEDQDLQTTIYLQSQIPLSSNSYTIVQNTGLNDSIINGLTEVSRLSKIEVAFYYGLVPVLEDSKVVNGPLFKTYYPLSGCDTNPVYGPIWIDNGASSTPRWICDFSGFETKRYAWFNPAAIYTMSLNGHDGIIASYRQQKMIDTSKDYTFIFRDDIGIFSDKLFEYKNQYYMPISLERIKSKNKGLVKGLFYRML